MPVGYRHKKGLLWPGSRGAGAGRSLSACVWQHVDALYDSYYSQRHTIAVDAPLVRLFGMEAPCQVGGAGEEVSDITLGTSHGSPDTYHLCCAPMPTAPLFRWE